MEDYLEIRSALIDNFIKEISNSKLPIAAVKGISYELDQKLIRLTRSQANKTIFDDKKA